MIKAKHSLWFDSIFNLYISYAYKRHFKRINTIGTFEDKGLPVLVLCNHIGWWDGFWILRLNKKFLKRRFHVMMLDEQLRRNMFLRKLGAFSIRKRSRGMRDSLAYASNVLDNSENLLLFFPQGKFYSQHTFPLVFEKGLDRILLPLQKPVQVLIVVHLLDYFADQKPTLSQYVFGPEVKERYTSVELEELYNNFMHDCLQKQRNLQ